MFDERHLYRRLRNILSGAALAAALFLGNPAGAQAAGFPSPAGVWKWIEGLLADPIAAVTGARTIPRHTTQAKDVVCPPTGCPTTPSTSAPQGPGIDPDGKTH